MRSSVRKIGNSAGVILPKPFLASIGAEAGDAVDVTMEDDRIIIVAAPKKHPREGWEEEARAMAEAGADGLVWPEFGNDFDVEEWDGEW
ncbi:antitoxin [Caulobacter sp. Root1455]|jgi:antitoxin MazE|uniref:AbrB/MazE/SpoVT family DNA-binding domain-containing protein n=1 Tax=unclassified Caulobacter TaxID=2648921 RepID=UPI0006F4046E|nr:MULTISPECIES: AbrB/MazE/SpoVT family DNA-binding domain-containing protein [unclassified Caulobacter]KQY29476.1 antitoxin [Caulobacter sp. Root487D2Y]KQY95945.1 antitoxin [Caulobacter sp. Root1455]